MVQRSIGGDSGGAVSHNVLIKPKHETIKIIQRISWKNDSVLQLQIRCLFIGKVGVVSNKY